MGNSLSSTDMSRASKDKGILRYPKWIIPNGNVYYPTKYRLFGESSDTSEILITYVDLFHILCTWQSICEVQEFPNQQKPIVTIGCSMTLYTNPQYGVV